MRTLLSCLMALVLGVATLSPGQAKPNTESGTYRVDAVMTAGGTLLRGPAQVYVLDSRGEVVARRHAVPAVFDLPDGDYTAALVYRNARARGAIRPGTSPRSNVMNLDAGRVRLDLVANSGERARVTDLSWTIYRYRPGSGPGAEVTASQERRPELTLDAGWYEVHARQTGKTGRVDTKSHLIEVKPGRHQTYSIVVD